MRLSYALAAACLVCMTIDLGVTQGRLRCSVLVCMSPRRSDYFPAGRGHLYVCVGVLCTPVTVIDRLQLPVAGAPARGRGHDRRISVSQLGRAAWLAACRVINQGPWLLIMPLNFFPCSSKLRPPGAILKRESQNIVASALAIAKIPGC